MLSSSSSLFDSLPARPPTPPREISKAIDDAISFFDDSNEVDRLTSRRVLDPRPLDDSSEATPSSSQETSRTGSTAKRVGFSPHPLYHTISRPGQLSSPSLPNLKYSPSTKGAKPLKSILKLSNGPLPLTPEDLDSKLSYFSPEIPGSFTKMLQSFIHQLAGPSRSSRLDAYLALNGALKAYEGVPDPSAMTQKMGLIMQFLTRDMAWKSTDGQLDTNIITQALKLAITLLFDSKLSEALDDDFRSFLLDRSIAVMEQPDMPKPIVKSHMYLLAKQRFQPRLMTAGRAEKIVTALHTIEDRCSGNGLIATRLVIYLRLVEQAPAVMLMRARDWLEHVFHGMLSSIKDVRIRAIETCTRAGLVLGQQPQTGKALRELFETEVEQGQSYCDYLSVRLIQMASDKEVGAYVPQIWSAVILFFRCKRCPLEKWPKFKSWLLIIQKCLNSSDIMIRYQATLAWSKLVFAIMPDSSTTTPMMSMLKIPLCTGMDKRGADKYSKQVRQYSLDSYNNLLHYALRPGLSHEEYDDAWDTFVEPVLSDRTKFSGEGCYIACRILCGLFSATKGSWNVNAALDLEPVKAEDLPRLDPRWVRSRLGKILRVLQPIITAGVHSSAEANAAVDATWHALMQSIADAGSQEVKTTHDLKEAIALILTAFRRFWTGYISRPTETDETVWPVRYFSLVTTMVSCLGTGSFAEDILVATRENNIEVVPTPSHRASKHHSSPQSPLVILFDQFYHLPKDLSIENSYQALAVALLHRLLSSRSTPSAKLELLNRSLQALITKSDAEVNTQNDVLTWIVFARSAIDVLKPETLTSNMQESQGLGHGLRSALDILLSGLEFDVTSELSNTLKGLYDSMFAAAQDCAGEGGVVLAVMEPLAKALTSGERSVDFGITFRLATHMLQKPVWPRTRQSIDQASKALLGVGLAPHRATIHDPFDHVYTLFVDLMLCIYNTFRGGAFADVDAVRSFTNSSLEFLQLSPCSLLPIALRKMQDGFAAWVADKDRKTSGDEDLSALVTILYPTIRFLANIAPASKYVVRSDPAREYRASQGQCATQCFGAYACSWVFQPSQSHCQ